MRPADERGLFAALNQLTDPRGRKGQRHPFTAMLAATICATLCGITQLKTLEKWLRSQDIKLCHWLGFKRNPPCANCFAKLFQKIDPDEFEAVVRAWTTSLDGLEIDEDDLQAVSIDGKTLCGTMQRHQRTLHLLSAFDHKTGYVLSQLKRPPETNEHKAALSLLKTLVLKGKVIIGDAMFCQRDVCEQVIDSGGDYFVVVKKNQETLHREIALAFGDGKVFSPLSTASVGSGA